jgi:hypothetical protein
VLAAAFSEARGSTAGASLGHWLGQDLFPWLETELADHPRLAGRRLHIAAIDEDGKKQPLDALTGEIVNKISGHLVAESRLRVVLPANPDAGRIETPARDCDPWLGADMVIGVDTRTIGERRARITVRVLDPADQEWVAGLQRQWTGRLSRKQRDAQYRAMPGSKPEGTGNDPLLPDQPDVAANRLARVLACQVLTGRTRPVLAAATNGLTAFEISVRDALYATGAVSMSADGNAIVRVTGHPVPGAHRLAATLFETGTDDDADGGPSDRSTETPIVVASVHVVGVPTYPVGTLANDASKTRAEASPAGQTAHAPFVAVSAHNRVPAGSFLLLTMVLLLIRATASRLSLRATAACRCWCNVPSTDWQSFARDPAWLARRPATGCSGSHCKAVWALARHGSRLAWILPCPEPPHLSITCFSCLMPAAAEVSASKMVWRTAM